MGVPGFYSWLKKRYPQMKHNVGKRQLPQIDYLYLDMNGIIYRAVKDDSVMFKSQILPRQLEQIWIEVFNYINLIVNLLKPQKMIFMALDGVAPRSKMNNQRARRFKSAKQHREHMENFYGYADISDSQENFKNNSISPGTKFMQQLNKMIRFFIAKKLQEDDFWKKLSIIFTGSDCPGQGQHKIMQFIRANKYQFQPEDNHCLYGADADLIMLGLTLPMKNICIIRQQWIPSKGGVQIVSTRRQKHVQFEVIYLTILRQYFNIEYKQIEGKMKHLKYSLDNILFDFVFLFFFIGNDFLPRCMAYNIRKQSIEKLIEGFKNYLIEAESYIVGQQSLNVAQIARLTSFLAVYEKQLISQKTQDAEKFLKEKEKFHDELSQQMKLKVMKEAQFLLQMKTLYNNEGTQKQICFYENKFEVNPINNTQQYYKILAYYVYGLNFVYQYYFVNLPSWQWYYPYYYAPLLSDLAHYLAYCTNVKYKFQNFEMGKPFQPFKQLLCILPKQSAELLPKSFQNVLLDENSALRSPVDYYPDDFPTDLFGSTYQYEAISIIPFLDHNMIDHVYSTALQNVQAQQRNRNNSSHNNELYNYMEDCQQIIFQSPFEHIQDVRQKIKVTNVDFLNKFDWPQKGVKNNVKYFRMPTLQMRQFQVFTKTNKYNNLSFLIQLTQSQQKEEYKLGQLAFYGFPLEHSGTIQAIVTRSDFKALPDFNPNKYDSLDFEFSDDRDKDYLRKKTKQLFSSLISSKKINDLYPFVDLKKCTKMVFIADTQFFVRTVSGNIAPSSQKFSKSNQHYDIIPFSLLSKQKMYENTKSMLDFTKLEDQFSINERVLVLKDKKYVGAVGVINSFNQQTKKVKVTIKKELKRIPQDTLRKIVSTNQIFFTLRFISQIVGMKHDILLTILGSIHVSLPALKNLPSSIDIGLNFIHRNDEQLVPNLVRINYDKENFLPKQAFKKLQFSVRALELIIQYKNNYSDVFNFIQQRHERLVQQRDQKGKINWKQEIKAQSIFQSEDAAVKSLMKVYLWLIKKKQTHMPLSSIYSKQISTKRISKLQAAFLQKKEDQKTKKKKVYQQPKQMWIDPNLIITPKLSGYALIYLAKQPNNHHIGDQVICLKPQNFGDYGVIVGIDQQKFQVLFEKPSFGKTKLGGLCENLWGGKFNYRDLFSITTWPEQIQQRRQQKNIVKNLGWIQSHNQYYPKFKSKPIHNFKDAQLFFKQKPEFKQLWQYIEKVFKKINPIDIDPQYIIVDNYNEDHLYKYNKNELSVEQGEVKKIQKNLKWVQKPIQKSEVVEKKDQFQPEIVESKVQQEKKIAEQQEDAGDIIG